MDLHPLATPLDQVFGLLATNDPVALRQGKSKLRNLVEEEGDILLNRLNPVNIQTKALPKYLNEKVFQLLQAPETRLGGLAAIELLMKVDYSDLTVRTTFFSRQLCYAAKGSDNLEVVKVATSVWGDLLDNGCALLGEIVQAEAVDAIERLDSENSLQRICGCFFLLEMFRQTPTVMNGKMDDILVCTWDVVKDPLVECRQAAGAVLKAVFFQLKEGGMLEPRHVQEFVRHLQQGVASKTPDLIHGTLVALTESTPVLYSEPPFRDVVLSALQLLSKLSQMPTRVRKQLLDLLPQVAEQDSDRFIQQVLPQVVGITSTVFRDPSFDDCRGHLFLTFGKVGEILGERVLRFLDQLATNIKIHLTPSNTKKVKRERCPSALTCLARLTKSQPGALRGWTLKMMDEIFMSRLTTEFAADVAVLSSALPEIQFECAHRVLNLASVELQRLPEKDPQRANALVDIVHSLRHPEFSGDAMLGFVVTYLSTFLCDSHPEVRKAVVDLCAATIFSACGIEEGGCTVDSHGAIIHSGRRHTELVTRMQQGLIDVAVADPDPDVRLSTLGMLGPRFDATLSVQDAVTALYPILSDKLNHRLLVLRVIGRLSSRNPAVTVPTLRRLVVQGLTECQNLQHDNRKQQEAFVVLGTILESSAAFIGPYLPSVFNTILEQLKAPDAPAHLQSACLHALGKLAPEAPEALKAEILDTFKVVVPHILDPISPFKRQEAVKALGAMVRATGHVSVFEDYPELMGCLVEMLHGGFKQAWPLRRDVLTLLGIIGAVDPARIKSLDRDLHSNDLKEKSRSAHISAKSDEGISQLVVEAILSTLHSHSPSVEVCSLAVSALVRIMTSMAAVKKQVVVGYIPRVIEEILHHINGNDPSLRSKLFQELTSFVATVRHHIRGHLDPVLVTIKRHVKHVASDAVKNIMSLLTELRLCLHEELKPKLPALLPILISIIQSENRESTSYILQCLESFGKLLEDYLHIVLPSVVDVLTHVNYSLENRTNAANVITCLGEGTRSMADHVARCIHAFCRVLAEDGRAEHSGDMEKLHKASLKGIIALAGCSGEGFAKFVPLIEPHVMKRFGHRSQNHIEFTTSATNAIRGMRPHHNGSMKPTQRPAAVHDEPRTTTDFALVKHALEVVDRTGDEEWKQWLRQFCLNLLQCSPSVALRVSTTLAKSHEPFSRQLFYPAFASCYLDMDAATKNYVVGQIGKIMASDKVPSEVLQELLNLAEFLERENIVSTTGSASLFEVSVLAERSEFCNLNSKALHYLEVQFTDHTKQYEASRAVGKVSTMSEAQWGQFLDVCQKLIHQYNVLGLRECADGVLEYVKSHFSSLRGSAGTEFTVNDPSMYEKLRWWTESYKAFRHRYKKNPQETKNVLGVMTALDALGDFRAGLDTWKQFRKKPKRHDILSCAHFGARAAWLLHSWDDLDSAVRLMSGEGYSGSTASFYRAVTAVHNGSHIEAREYIEECRRRLDADLSALFAESYDRAYRHTVGLQQLCELEEIIDFQARGKKVIPASLIRLWSKRLDLMSEDPSEWQGTLSNHSLVVQQHDDLDSWLRFVTICRRNGRPKMAQEVLSTLLREKNISEVLLDNLTEPKVALAAAVHEYERGKRTDATSFLSQLVVQLQQRPGVGHHVVAQCHTQLATWLVQENPKYYKSLPVSNRIRSHLKQAVELDPSSMSSWHEWGVVQQSMAKSAEKGMVGVYASAAIQAFVQSIVLNDGRSVVQDVLGFLSLWFTFGGIQAVDDEVNTAITTVPVVMWLNVIPQIIARLHTEEATVIESVHKLLTTMGKAHPQALLFPLYVSVHETFGITMTTELEARCDSAERILAQLGQSSSSTRRLIEEAKLVSEEVIRMGILFVEWARTVFEQAHEEYRLTLDVNQLWSTITAFRALIDCPQTPSEESFKQEFGPKLHEVCTLLTDLKNGKLSDVEVVFNQFRSMATTIEKQILPSMLSLDLQFISPALAESGNNLSLVIPGKYDPANPSSCPTFQSFSSTLRIIKSIRRPRRLAVHGSDGVSYKFLLKGHEDMRQDERVMQVLGLVNTLLKTDSATVKKELSVVQIPVIPLSDNVGIMTWVDDCTTFYDIIVEHRASVRVPLNKELLQICAFSDDTTTFTVLQRVEVLEAAQEQTDGNDIAYSMWSKAPNAEVWIDRRTHYTKTVATTSMLGHILGLGDRHLQNLMLQNYTGKVIHIDFGDCFESAQVRSIAPEKWPFRLTRMLVKGFEVSGLKGMFQHSCVSVMDVQRNGKESLMAMLEAFVHDPLISWRLNETKEGPQVTPTNTEAPTAAPAPGGMPMTTSTTTADLSRSLAPGSIMPSSMNMARTSSMRSLRARKAMRGEEVQSKQGERVVERIRQKLNGTEFDKQFQDRSTATTFPGREGGSPATRGGRTRQSLSTQDQVERLVEQATSLENLAQAYIGWCPFW